MPADSLQDAALAHKVDEMRQRLAHGEVLLIERPALPIGVAPVSYTHLDVYKRQAESRRIRGIGERQREALLARLSK